MRSKAADWMYLGREALLLLTLAYVIILGGGFTALVDFRIQAFSTILAVLILGVWLIARLVTRTGLTRSGVDWAILLFLLSQFVAVAFSEDPRRSLPHAVVWLVYVFVFYFVLDLLRRGWPQELFVKCLLIVAAIVLAFSTINLAQLLLQWRSLIAGLEFAPSFQQRLSTILGDPNLLAAFTNLLFPLALASLLIAKSKAMRLVLSAYSIASLLILYFTDSRGGLLGAGAAITTFAVLWILVVSEPTKAWVWKQAAWLWQRKLVLLSLAAIAVIGVVFVALRFLSFQGNATHGRVVDARDVYWQAATDAIQADPLTGAGPGMYPIYLMKIWSTPPARPYLHAHGLPFQIGAESGLLGLAAFVFLLIAVTRHAWTAWRGLDTAGRARWVAAVAGLIGLIAHSLVDDFFPFPVVGVVAFCYLAFVIFPAKVKKKRRDMSPWVLLAPGLAAAVFTGYCLNAYWHADKAIASANSGDWEDAASEMQTAANADPALAWYWLQLGYAYGRVAESGPDALEKAISAYETAINIEPVYSVNRANLASLYWVNGDKEESLDQMRIATSIARDAWLIQLNNGVYLEDGGSTDLITASYGKALELRPGLLGSEFWNESEIRAASALAYETAGLDDDDLIQDAGIMVDASEFDAARSLFAQAYAISDQDPRLYIGLAELAFGTGDLELAEKYVQTALWILTSNNEAKAEAILLGAEISLANGDESEALRQYEIGFQVITSDTSYGWGSYGWSPYAWFVFQRVAFPEDLLPQLERADISTEIAARLLPLIDLYEDNGENQKAKAVAETLSAYLP